MFTSESTVRRGDCDIAIRAREKYRALQRRYDTLSQLIDKGLNTLETDRDLERIQNDLAILKWIVEGKI